MKTINHLKLKIMLLLTSNKKNYGIEIPTTLQEIDETKLAALTSNLKLSKHYCVIALVYRAKLYEFAGVNNGKKEKMLNVVPILAKINDNESKELGINVGERVCMDARDIEYGIRYNPVNNALNVDRIIDFISDDKELSDDILSGRYFVTDENQKTLDAKRNSPTCHLLDFKIIPVSAIRATFSLNEKMESVFVKDMVEKQ